MKKFWKKTEGFTLVELIVVIAILGILAGVGTVGYSGYIKKANMAADQQLLHDLNTAFAIACIENGVPNTQVTAENINVPSGVKVDGTILEVTATATVPAAKAGDIETAFGNYFEGGEFKVMTVLNYESGVFVDGSSGVTKVSYRGVNMYLSQADLERVKESNFGTIGAEKLLTETASVVDWAADKGLAAMGGEQFMSAFAGYLGLSGDASVEDFQVAVMELAGGEDPDAMGQISANAVALYAAKNAGSVTTGSLSRWFGGSEEDMYGEATGNTLSEAAAIYGLYVSYKGGDVPGSAMTNLSAALSDGEFHAWVNTDKGKQELAAFQSAMSIVGAASSDSSTTREVLKNGFKDEELIELMSGLIDKTA